VTEIDAGILAYNQGRTERDREICERLCALISEGLPGATSKIWHGSPVWFLEENPIVGYHSLKHFVRLLFWSGQSFDEPDLKPEGSFKAAEARYTSPEQLDREAIARWLGKAATIQWDYKNIVKRKGQLERLDVTAG
jgi:hypothetical protein